MWWCGATVPAGHWYAASIGRRRKWGRGSVVWWLDRGRAGVRGWRGLVLARGHSRQAPPPLVLTTDSTPARHGTLESTTLLPVHYFFCRNNRIAIRRQLINALEFPVQKRSSFYKTNSFYLIKNLFRCWLRFSDYTFIFILQNNNIKTWCIRNLSNFFISYWFWDRCLPLIIIRSDSQLTDFLWTFFISVNVKWKQC